MGRDKAAPLAAIVVVVEQPDHLVTAALAARVHQLGLFLVVAAVVTEAAPPVAPPDMAVITLLVPEEDRQVAALL